MRNAIKRTFSVWSLVVLMIAIMMTGCSTNNAEPSPAPTSAPEATAAATVTAEPEPAQKEFENKELNVAVFEGGYGKAYWEAVVARFEADYPGVKINLSSNPKIMDVIKPQIVAGNPPDFIYIRPFESTGTIISMLNEGGLLDLTDVYEGKALDQDIPLKDKLIDGILEYAKPLADGKIYYAPAYISSNGIWYNKTLFEQKGWKVPTTWDEFLAMGEVAKAEGRSLFTYQGIYPSYNEQIILSSIASASGTDALKKVTSYEENSFNTDAVKQILAVYDTMAKKGYLLPGTVALNHTQAQTEFLQGKALFIPNGNWFENEMKDAPREEGFEFGFMAPPVFKEGDTRYTSTSFEAMYIPAKAKNIELAKEFLRYQYNDEIVKLNAEKSQGVMPVKNGVELAKPFISTSVYNSIKIFDEGVKPLLYSWKVTPKTEVAIYDEVYNPLSSMMNKSMTADEWISRVEKAFSKLRDVIAKGE